MNERICKSAAKIEIYLWWIIRLLLAAGLFTAPTVPKKLMVLIALASTFVVSAAKKIFRNSNFFADISFHLQTCICVTALLGSGIGFGFDVFQKLPEYDILLNFYGGIVGTAIGYYISTAFRRPYHCLYVILHFKCVYSGERNLTVFHRLLHRQKSYSL